MKNTFFQNLNDAQGIVISIVVALFLAIVCVASRSANKQDNTLVVGMMSGWAPFMSINTAGKFQGFDVDVAQELAKRMNKKLVIQDLGSVASCLVALEQKKIAMILSGLDITKKRQNAMAMIWYTGKDVRNFSLVFWKSIPENIKSMQDLRNLPNTIVCAESGSGQEAFLDLFDFITKKRMNTVIDIVLDLRFGKSLAAILEPPVAARLKRQNPELQILPVALPDDFQVYGCGIAIKKDNVDLTASVTSVIEAMQTDGTLAKLEQKWQLEE